EYNGTVSRRMDAARTGTIESSSAAREMPVIRFPPGYGQGICYIGRDRGPLGLELLEVLGPKFRDLGGDDRAAIRLVGVPSVVLAVVFLGRIEGDERLDLGHDRVVKDVFGCQLLDYFLRRATLLVIMIENRRAVLRA